MRVDEKPLIWLGSSRKDLLAMPRAVRREFGFALHLAQIGTKHPGAKVLRGFRSATPRPDVELIHKRLDDARRLSEGD